MTVMQPTNQLRLVRVSNPSVDTPYLAAPRSIAYADQLDAYELQHLWVGDDGTSEWQAVPVVQS